MTTFDWNRAIEINRAALLGVVVALVRVLARGEVEGTVYLAPATRRFLLRLLVPAEAAARRLIFICVRVMKIKPASPSKSDRALPDFAAFAFARAPEDFVRTLRFQLADPRKRLDWSAFGFDDQEPESAPTPKVSQTTESSDFIEPVSCTDLLHRTKAMEAALENLKKSARRMAREEAKRNAAEPGPKHMPPLRVGPPPGRRLDGREDVDDILKECHGLVTDVERWPP
ncbi:MAG: hypothetical protein AAFO77_00335 [Pseudomonadota bacterium]